MKRITGWILLLAAYSHTVQACDVCGCTTGGGYLGILPRYQQHFVGMNYRYQTFTSTHPERAGAPASTQTEDYFRSLTLWGRFYPAKRVQLFVFLPYHANKVTEPGSTTLMQGVGDIQLLANYMLVNNADSGTGSWKHTLMAGGGIKLPTGKNTFTNTEGIILSNMQPGTGSWDFVANANYTLRYRGWGFNTDAIFRLPTVNRRDYRYGNRLSSGYTLFYWQQWESLSLLPQAGLRHEWSEQDYSNYSYGIRNSYSGGYQLYLQAGAAVYLQHLGMQALVGLPVSEHYAGGLVRSRPRLEMQIQYLF
jgi:hypothetical protein